MTHDFKTIQTTAVAALLLLALAACAGDQPSKGESVWRDTTGQARSDAQLTADVKSCNLANRSAYSPAYAGEGSNPYLAASNMPSGGQPYPEFKTCMDARGWQFIETR